ncbi:flagellar basal body-associated FliL family protein [Litoreibacter roseus]|uniref:Flagellar protein FliL n=1 Tax=Litoreibacter roseus TaxID=2601869 RepID=A0A6N6JGH9_9RHOB|nr:flagellar basal body-associated FliL family protein [Litoreibacter roseus]GFE64398.1 flagellar basal body protein FliL [Litoreibacter roseus]
MSDEETDQSPEVPKGGKKGFLIGLILAFGLGSGAFYATYSGMILGPKTDVADHAPVKNESPVVSFVPIDPMIISLGTGNRQQLRFNAQLEVDPAYTADVSHLMPRILDILNGYLRAVDITELEDPAALIRLRAQMLRRVQLVTGEGYVRDLLITEFVFS